MSKPSRVHLTSGHWVVLGMFCFGLSATSLLFLYWEWHTAPFSDVQDAIAARYEDSKPRVEAGRHKTHKNGPLTFRIVMQVPFNPETDHRQAEAFVTELLQFVSSYRDLRTYETLHVHLYQPDPEQRLRQKSFHRAVAQSVQAP
ncbi:hypothetical protein [Thalassoroseus pseudoceratinae]|uniref:hypothetical protein n=1 Tax=Thalassoroseus pseudoceratinae TaxID=2713176 RepID=UPI001420C08E|nr:hypothetical protein [Thalassoroseus pseudoceratinae]